MTFWIFLVVVLLENGDVGASGYGKYQSEADCQHGQREFVLPKGQEMLFISPCIKFRDKSKR